MHRYNLGKLVVAAVALCWVGSVLAQPVRQYLRELKEIMSQPERQYFLEHEFSGKYVCTGAKHDGAFVHLWGPIPAGHEPHYRFKIVASGEQGYYYLIHQHSGKYICTGDTEDGARIHLWGGRSPLATRTATSSN